MRARRTTPALLAAALGIALALAPVGFQMFSRAPKGGEMIEGFRPYMQRPAQESFRSHLATIGAAQQEAAALPTARTSGSATGRFVQAWPGIDDDMTSMLDTMEQNIGRYRGIDALPPFALFPWFFVIPGVLIAGVALGSRRPAAALAALGVGLLLAPAVFQMFSRAPGGAAMIDDFRPMMTPEKVIRIQGYFLTIGGAEAELRREVVPGAPAGQLPAISELNRQWPAISSEMAPMIGAMADNIDNFAAVTALPPFGLFPWFFVAPGVLLLGLAAAIRRHAAPAAAPDLEPEAEARPLQGAVT